MILSYTGTDLIDDALTDLCVLVPGQTADPDVLAIGLRTLNQLIDWLLIDRLMVYAILANIYDLASGVQTYTIGPTVVSPNFVAPRPTGIEDANVILNTFNPVNRFPLTIIDEAAWSRITVQQLPFAIPQVLYYDKNFDSAGGFGTINLWPGPLTNYQLELFTWQQLQNWPDLTTAIKLPPGYALMLRSNFAVLFAPTAKAYFKTEPMLDAVQATAMRTKAEIESYNAPDAILQSDPMFQGASANRSAWNFGTGMVGRDG